MARFSAEQLKRMGGPGSDDVVAYLQALEAKVRDLQAWVTSFLAEYVALVGTTAGEAVVGGDVAIPALLYGGEPEPS